MKPSGYLNETPLYAADFRNINCPACKMCLGGKHAKETSDAVRKHFNEYIPVAGSITICMSCTAFIMFDGKSASHVMTETELDALPVVERAQLAYFAEVMRKEDQ